MKPAEAQKTTIWVKAGEYLFKASGEVITYRGFLQVYQPEAEVDRADDSGEFHPENLPRQIEKGDPLTLLQLLPEQHFTRPPARYTESSLVKTLDKLGIGRPSTYAQIISTLFNRKYVEKEDRALKPTELGKVVNDLLVKNFPNIFNVKFTARMEDELDKIEHHQASYVEVLDDFYHPFKETLEKVNGKVGEIRTELQETTEEKCELRNAKIPNHWRNPKPLR